MIPMKCRVKTGRQLLLMTKIYFPNSHWCLDANWLIAYFSNGFD